MKYADLTALDQAQVLALVEKRQRARRAGEVADMRLALHWCVLHSGDPQAEPGVVPKSKGGDYLRQLGGEGTPAVADLCVAELAIGRAAGEMATSHYVGDCLDVEHRLPLLGGLMKELLVEPWVVRKIARMSRKLPLERVGLVDVAMAAAAFESPGRLIEIAEAKIIEADPEAHRAKLAEDAKKTGVWLSKARPGELIDDDGEPATLRLSSKLPAGAAVRCDENVDDLALAIFDHTEPDAEGNRPSHAECRQTAFEMLLSEPHKAAAFLSTHDADPSAEPAPEIPKPKKKRRPAEITVHISAAVLAGQVDGVARVEGIGPVLLSQLSELLEDREIHLQPVIDLNQVAAVNSYEHPTAMRKRTLLRTGGDVFPHTTSRSTTRLDHDHPTPYDPGGPPGQTSDLNDAPLTRKHHRAKTHLGYHCEQIALGAYRWITPHGLARVVTPSGTRKVEVIYDHHGKPVGEIYHDGPHLEIDLDYRGSASSADDRPG